MLGKILRWGVFLGLIGLGVFWWITRPEFVAPEALAGLAPDPARGQQVFDAAGCASCHVAPKSEEDQRLTLSGGQRFPSPFGTFVAPNISSDPTHGIGGWTQAQFVTAVTKGTNPDGQHYYPAFPYATYTRMTLQDAASLWAYMQTLPADTTPNEAHEVVFPFNIRRSLGGWKFLFMNTDWVAEVETGRYLVEAMGHCAECHTPRNLLGGLDTTRWMQGAPNPSGKGRIPPLTPDKLVWSEVDIAEYLKSGFTPDFDSAGGHMVAVIENTSRLSDDDRAAIAAYLKALPAP